MTVMLTDERIYELLKEPKWVKNPKAREVPDAKHLRRDYKVSSETGEEFTVFTRQHQEMLDDFSAGLIWHPTTGDSVILMRCNGSSHRHTNHLEGSEFAAGNCHVHMATERYIDSGRSPEHFAQVTVSYSTLEGALHHLCKEGNIDGLDTSPELPDMFRQ